MSIGSAGSPGYIWFSAPKEEDGTQRVPSVLSAPELAWELRCKGVSFFGLDPPKWQRFPVGCPLKPTTVPSKKDVFSRGNNTMSNPSPGIRISFQETCGEPEKTIGFGKSMKSGSVSN